MRAIPGIDAATDLDNVPLSGMEEAMSSGQLRRQKEFDPLSTMWAWVFSTLEVPILLPDGILLEVMRCSPKVAIVNGSGQNDFDGSGRATFGREFND
jgi:hypothetical protein